jgi:hypothetical protein
MIINAKSRPPALNWEKITIVIPPPKKIFCRVQIQELIFDVKEDEGIKRRKEAGFDVHMVKPLQRSALPNSFINKAEFLGLRLLRRSKKPCKPKSIVTVRTNPFWRHMNRADVASITNGSSSDKCLIEMPMDAHARCLAKCDDTSPEYLLLRNAIVLPDGPRKMVCILCDADKAGVIRRILAEECPEFLDEVHVSSDLV